MGENDTLWGSALQAEDLYYSGDLDYAINVWESIASQVEDYELDGLIKQIAFVFEDEQLHLGQDIITIVRRWAQPVDKYVSVGETMSDAAVMVDDETEVADKRGF